MSVQRNKEIKAVENEIAGLLNEVAEEDRVKWLSRQIVGNQSKLYGVKTQAERQSIEMYMDVFKSKLEQLGAYIDEDDDQLWQGYPELNDPQFNRRIFEKQEFHKYKIPKQGLDQFSKTETLEFTRNPTQNFIGAYMSPSTPFNGLLLWLGVGVGKTCAAITAAENYRREGGEFTRSKILVLLPADSLVRGWKNQIFNVEKDIKNKDKNINVQCTGSTYLDELRFYDEMTQEQKERRVNKVIHKYYEFLGYRKFSNRVKNEIADEVKGREDREYLKMQVIRKKYSNRIFILDEVHFTREYSSKNDNKDITEILELIARYGENNKFILASATPMYNSASEIIEILNLLLLNDKRAPIEGHQVFKADGFELTERGEQILVQKSRGYISFLRGENPITFPVKIYPQLTYPVRTYRPNPKYTYRKNKLIELDEGLKIKDLLFVKNNMSQFQYAVYKEYAVSDKEDQTSDNFSIPSTVASNIIFPNRTGGKEFGQIGDEGFDDAFSVVSLGNATENKSNLKFAYKDYNTVDENGIPFLDETRLARYSKKFYNILQLAKNSTGILFLFSRYLKPGIVSLALMLEQNGYARFNEGGVENNMLDYPVGIQRCYCGKLSSEHKGISHEFKQGRYIFLTGETPKSTLNDLIDYSNMTKKGSVPNLYGQNIKFILGSNVVEQGINMFNIREVHVLDPWYHFNRIEQVVGRAIRNKSHMMLPPEERNVSVYLHCSTIPDENEKDPELRIETTDEKNYRLAYAKSKKIAHITRILKSNAVDCMLNKNGNQLTVEYFGNTPLNIVTSQGITISNQFYGDRDYDIMCDYDKCEYSCQAEPTGVYVPKINTDTYEDILSMEDLSVGKKNIAQIYRFKSAYTIDEILSLMDKYFSVDRDLTYRALNTMIQNREALYDKYKREGHLSYVHPYYVFTPKELDNEFSSLYARSIPLPVRGNEIVVSQVDEKLVKVSKKGDAEVSNETLVKDIAKFVNRVMKDYISNKNIYGHLADAINHEFIEALGVDNPQIGLDLVEQYFIFGMIDRLSFEQKRVLIGTVLTENIKRGGVFDPSNKLEQMVFRFYDKQGDSNRYSIFREQRDLNMAGVSKNLPVVFRLFRQVRITKKDGTSVLDYELVFFRYAPTKEAFELANPIEMDEYRERFGYVYNELKTTEADKVYGYLQEKERRAHAKLKAEEEIGEIHNEPEFYLVNRRFHVAKKNKDDTLQHKSEIKGAVCGTCTDKAELIDIIKYVLNVEGSAHFEKFLKEKSKVNKHKGIFEDLAKSGSLCEIIELVLRHRQFINPTEHFFYNHEEWLFMRSSRTQMEQELKKKEEEAKLAKPKPTRGRKPSAKKTGATEKKK